MLYYCAAEAIHWPVLLLKAPAETSPLLLKLKDPSFCKAKCKRRCKQCCCQLSAVQQEGGKKDCQVPSKVSTVANADEPSWWMHHTTPLTVKITVTCFLSFQVPDGNPRGGGGGKRN